MVDSIAFDTPRTKDFIEFLKALKVDRSALVALATDNHNARLSGRNVQEITLCQATQLNCFDMLNNRYLVIAKADLEAWLAGPWSQTGKDAKIAPQGRAAGEVKA